MFSDNDNTIELQKAAKRVFFDSIANFPSEELRCNVDKLGELDENDLRYLNALLQKNTGIKILGLAGNSFGQIKERMVLLVKLLEDNPQIKFVDLFLNFINTESIDIILQSEKLRPRLKNIDFRFVSNIIDDAGYKKAFQYLSAESVRSIIFGNRLQDMDYVNKHYPESKQQSETHITPVVNSDNMNKSSIQTSQSGIFSSSNKNYDNSTASAGKYISGESSNLRKDEHKEQTPPKSPKTNEECKERTPPKKNSI